MALKTIRNLRVRNQVVILRADFNVSFWKGKILDDFRIKAVKPTVDYLRHCNAKIIILTHWGRPRGYEKKYSLRKLLPTIKKVIGSQIHFAPDCIGSSVRPFLKTLKPKEILILENLRFHQGEEKNSSSFAEELARLGNIYINDAFAASHRPHASIVAITQFLPSRAGLLLEREIGELEKIFSKPKRPLTFIIGGAKTSDKLLLIRRVLKEADHLLLGGVLANTVLRAQGVPIGRSLYDRSALPDLKKIKFFNSQVFLPEDGLVAASKNGRAKAKYFDEMKRNEIIFDVGPITVIRFIKVIKESKMVVWNGPLGYYEIPKFAQGTKKVAQALARSSVYSIIGGGDIIAAFDQFGLLNKVNHVSTGGGAMLEFLAGKKLPGLKALGYYGK